jgi:hypothetical protein
VGKPGFALDHRLVDLQKMKEPPDDLGRLALEGSVSSSILVGWVSLLLLEAAADVEFGEGFPCRVAGDDFGVDVGLSAIVEDQAVAGLSIEDFELFSRHLKVAVECFPALVFMTGQVAVDPVQNDVFAVEDFSANAFHSIHRSPPEMSGHGLRPVEAGCRLALQPAVTRFGRAFWGRSDLVSRGSNTREREADFQESISENPFILSQRVILTPI